MLQVCVLGLVSVLVAPDASLPPEIKAGLPQIMAGTLRLLGALKEQKEEMDKLAEEVEGCGSMGGVGARVRSVNRAGFYAQG